MEGEYSEDRAFADRLEKETIKILLFLPLRNGECCVKIRVATVQEDRELNCDYVGTFRDGSIIHISARITRYGKYGTDIKFRNRGRKGNPNSEVSKIKNGLGHVMLYMEASQDETYIEDYILLNLSIVCDFLKNEDATVSKYYGIHSNKDGSECRTVNLYQLRQYNPKVVIFETDKTKRK